MIDWPNPLSSGFRNLLRFGELAGVMTRTGMEWLTGDRPPVPRLLRRFFEQMGPTYIKLAQFIASTPTLFPPEYVKEFEHCLDRTEPLPFARLERVLRQEIGQPLSTIFRDIDTRPLASASIAQVHAAIMPDGREAVIKIRRPGVRDLLLGDLHFLHQGARILEFLSSDLSRLSPVAVVEEIAGRVQEECDFRREADYMEKFDAFLKQGDFSNARVPRVYRQAVTAHVLTMERFHGIPLHDPQALRVALDDPTAALSRAMNVWLASLAGCDFFHADLHAGNLLILTDGSVGFLDFGIVGHLSPRTRRGLHGLAAGFAAGDFGELARSLKDIGSASERTADGELARELEDFFSALAWRSSDMGSGGAVLDEDLRRLDGIVRRHRLHFPREFTMLLKQILYFAGYLRYFSPEREVLSELRERTACALQSRPRFESTAGENRAAD